MLEQLAYYENKLRGEIDSWDLKATLEQEENVVVIDTRTAQAFAAEHIPKAVNDLTTK